MADILISKFTTQIPRVGATPATPGFAESEGQDPVAPSGTPQVYTPVTIGSPANGLSIDGSQVLTIGLASTSTTGALSSTDWNTFNGKIGGSGTTNYIPKFTGSGTIGDSAVFESGGNVGIGGVTPNEKLDVNGSITLPWSSTDSYKVKFYGGGTYEVGMKLASSFRGLEFFSIHDDSGQGFSFVTGTGVSNSEKVRITSSGNLLVGTTTDSGEKLQVSGNVRVSSSLDSFIKIFNSANTSGFDIGLSGGIPDGFIFQRANAPIIFGTNNTEQARITSSGNVLIGTTTDSGQKLQVSGTALVTGNIRTLGSQVDGTTGFEMFDNVTGGNHIGSFTRRDNGIGIAAFDYVSIWTGATSGISSGTEKVRITSSGNLLIGTTTDSGHKLNVNGEARIQTINNLGVSATSVLVPSATGVVSLRTLAELSADMSSVLFTAQTLTASQKNQARVNIGSTSATPQIVTTVGTINDLVITSNNIYFTGAGSVTLTGIQGQLNGQEITILNLTGNDLIFLQDSSLSLGSNRFLFSLTIPNNCFTTLKYDATSTLNRWKSESTVFLKSNVGGTITDLSGSALTLNGLGTTGGATGVFNINSSGGTGRLAMVVNNAGGTSKVFTIFNSGNVDSLGVISHLRSNSSITSTRRDELYLNYAETVATAGTINNLAINASTKFLILTGATDLTGVVPVDNGRLLRIEARSASRIIRHESASSTAANRFSIGADLTINAGEVYQFIYTNSRWRFINDTRDQFAVKTTASADQTLPSGTLTILDYDTTLLNNSTATYTVGTDGRITINITGIYTITAGVVIEADAVTALESAFLGIFRNGDLVAISSINTTIAAGTQSGLSTSTILSLTATDIIDCRALVNSVGGVANGLARRLGTLLGANATQVNSLSITKNSM